MVKSGINAQDMFLNYLRKEKMTVLVNLVNGTKINGTIKGFDNFSIVIRHNGNNREELIYKHAVSTILPQKNLSSKREPEFKNKLGLEEKLTQSGNRK
ncbi:MAG: RNA chaperone Hfq [Nitrospirota bacterium]